MLGRRGDPAVTDYVMSKLFGLDWDTYDAERVYLLLTVHNEKNLAEQRAVKKAESKANQRKH